MCQRPKTTSEPMGAMSAWRFLRRDDRRGQLRRGQTQWRMWSCVYTTMTVHRIGSARQGLQQRRGTGRRLPLAALIAVAERLKRPNRRDPQPVDVHDHPHADNSGRLYRWAALCRQGPRRSSLWMCHAFTASLPLCRTEHRRRLVKNWSFEAKLDGFRAQLHKADRTARI